MAEQIVVDGQIVEEPEETTETEETETLETQTEDVETEEEDDKTPEPWQATGDLDDVPAKTHIRVKQKLKGTISEQNEELERLRAENATLKATPEPKVLKRPRADDFEDDEEGYEVAKEQYEDAVAQDRYNRIDLQNRQKASQRQFTATIDASVDSHYKRADKLIADSGIKPEIYKNADQTVRLAVDTILPNQGDGVVDQIISFLGEGSEKVLYYLGNNKTALNEFKSLLAEDKSGMKAAVYLGTQKQRLTKPTKQTTRAPSPSPQLSGDAAGNSNNKALKKAYDKAHKSGDVQSAWNAKKTAKKAGADVSTW